ncbi:MAG: hypothetical protein K5891_09305 [Lachnospiraceae bacterium]|nr:hypothetical protein [Lachnospiraceae bacterium]
MKEKHRSSLAERISLLGSVMTLEMNHWSLFGLYVFLMLIFYNISGEMPPHIMIFVGLGIFPLLFFFLNRLFAKSFPFLGSSILVLVIWIMIPIPYVVKLDGFVFAAIYLIAECRRRFLRDNDPVIPIPAITGVVLAFVASGFTHYVLGPDWDRQLRAGVILCLLLLFLQLYLNQLQKFTRFNESTVGYLPVREMYRSGFSTTLLFSGLLAVALIIAGQFEAIQRGFRYLLGKFREFIVWFFSHFHPEEGPSGEVPEDLHLSDPATMQIQEGVQEPWPIWTVLSYLIFGVIIAVVVYYAAMGLFKLFLFLVKHRTAEVYSDSEEEGVMDLHERLSRAARRRFFGPDGKSVNDRIRRHYATHFAKRRESAGPGDPLRSPGKHTARALERISGSSGWSAIYEKARYSGRECTEEELAAFKGKL